MNIKEILKYTVKPDLYEKGSAVMWTDEYISEQLLQVHLNPELDLASRKDAAITKTVEWILEQVKTDDSIRILDLGCGPGLYTEKLAAKGHNVTGVDFSRFSIEYAWEETNNNGSGITYINSNYLELELEENSFDLVMMIYTDFGVLLPDERTILLSKVQKALKPGGIFIFDVISDKELPKRVTPDSWDAADKGFWKSEPYIALSRSFLYEEEKVILYQHIIIDEKNDAKIYRFWTHHFSHNELNRILNSTGFTDLEFNENVLPSGDLWDGDNITFCKAVNNK